MIINPGLISFFIPTHIDAAYLPGGISRSLLHVIDLQLHRESQYSNGHYNLYILWI